jgi:sugar lactone lactonase YvrE
MESYQAHLVRDGLTFGEAPRWHDGRLWYSDFYRHAIFSTHDGTDERLELMVPNQPSGLGWLPDGDLLFVSMTDQRVMRRHDDASVLYSDIAAYCGFWANDMVVSPTGYAYVGNFGFDLDLTLREVGPAGMTAAPPPTTNLVVIDPTGAVIQAVPDMDFPNGSVITPDGATLIVAETLKFRLSAFDVAADGTLSNRRVWAQLDFVAADGICLDADGQVWVANALAKQCLRVQEGGEITSVMETSDYAYACMLGGKDRKRLFVTTAPTSDRFKIADAFVGKIEAADVEVPGAGWP